MLPFPRCILFASLATLPLSAVAQLDSVPTSQNPSPDPATVAATTAKLDALRDAFVQKAKSAGSACSLGAPKIEVTIVPSFGNYDPDSNTLRISAWWLLNADQKRFFISPVQILMTKRRTASLTVELTVGSSCSRIRSLVARPASLRRKTTPTISTSTTPTGSRRHIGANATPQCCED